MVTSRATQESACARRIYVSRGEPHISLAVSVNFLSSLDKRMCTRLELLCTCVYNKVYLVKYAMAEKKFGVTRAGAKEFKMEGNRVTSTNYTGMTI